jgi:DNA-binding NarL/FixJ family response regulator
MKITIGLADDQLLFVRSLAQLIDTLPGFEVILEALNGEDLLRKLDLRPTPPDILLIDVDMPVMNGIDTVKRLTQKYANIKMVALTMKDDDATIIQMIRSGCCAYMLKDVHPDELEKALREIDTLGYYNADAYNINRRRLLSYEENQKKLRLSERELTFLQLASSDLTYKQIAGKMNLSDRTIDGYRESLFEKLNVQSRVGMVLEGLRLKMIRLETAP